MRRPTIAAGFARALIELAVQKDANREALAERSGIDPTDLADQDNRIAFPKFVALMRAAKELTGDPAFALHFGEAFGTDKMSIVGLITHCCETAADAFVQLNRYSRLILDVDLGGEANGQRFVLARERGALWMVDARPNPNDFPELTESIFARMVTRVRRFGGPHVVKAVEVTHAEPAYRAEYDRIFQVPVAFESQRNALQIDETFMSTRFPASNNYVFGVLSERAEALLRDLESAQTARGRVEILLMPILHTGDVGMDRIAGKLGVSRATLFRKLKAEGVTFEKVLDDLRHRLALDYLSGRRASVNQIAYLVGFSDAAAFSRAFKRWTGKSPRAMRSSRAHGGATEPGKS